MQDSTCPFCSESIMSSVFYTSDSYMAVYNIAPVLPGHSLVIPKNHITSILDLNEQQMLSFFKVAQTTLRILMKAFQTDAFDWSIQEKPEAGQTIEHLHLHIVPRLKNDLKQPGDWYPLLHQNDLKMIDSIERPCLKPEVLKTIVDKLKQVAKEVAG